MKEKDAMHIIKCQYIVQEQGNMNSVFTKLRGYPHKNSTHCKIYAF